MQPQEGLLGFLVGALVAGGARVVLRVAQPYLPQQVTRYPEVVPALVGVTGIGLAAAGYRDAGLGALAVSGAMLADDLAVRMQPKQAA